ncbi:MAG: ATP-binding protein [Bacteroidota bacterium]|nr:ATP-binding protein [Bacteroidota bacterium]
MLKTIKLKSTKLIQPGYIIAVVVVIAASMIISAIWELTQSRKELYHLMTEEATLLIETMTLSSANTVLSNAEMEDLIADRLLSVAYMVSELDSITAISNKYLKRIADENQVDRINIFDVKGNKIASSYTHDTTHESLKAKHSPSDFIQPILKGEVTELIIGLKEARYENGKRFAVAVRRKSNERGAVVVNIDAAYLLSFREKIGFGRMLQDIGNNAGIEYIVLQDSDGILAASKSVSEINSIEGDEFLENALQRKSVHTRVSSFNDMDEIHALEDRMSRRTVIISLVLFVLASLVIGVIIVNQNLKFVSREYEKIQTYTGSVIQNMADALITTDAEGFITIFNKQAENLCATDSHHVIGKHISKIFNNQLVVLAESLNTRNSLKNIELTVVCPNKGSRILAINTSFVYNEGDVLSSFTAALKDVTETRAMERHIQQREKLVAMGELASGVAHEIRNPLNSVNMIAQRYEKEFVPQANHDEYYGLTKILRSEVQRVNNIVQQFLRFARPPKLNIASIPSLEFLTDLKNIFEVQISSKNIELEISSTENCILNIDREQMKQVFLNLLQNSIGSMPQGGKISLKLFCNEDKRIFEFQDTGIGIPEKNLSKIFNLYFTTRAEGTGLGLSIVQQIVSQHDGLINVKSAQGTGTKFIIELPLKVS